MVVPPTWNLVRLLHSILLWSFRDCFLPSDLVYSISTIYKINCKRILPPSNLEVTTSSADTSIDLVWEPKLRTQLSCVWILTSTNHEIIAVHHFRLLNVGIFCCLAINDQYTAHLFLFLCLAQYSIRSLAVFYF